MTAPVTAMKSARGAAALLLAALALAGCRDRPADSNTAVLGGTVRQRHAKEKRTA